MAEKQLGRPRGGKSHPILRAYWRRLKEKRLKEKKEEIVVEH